MRLPFTQAEFLDVFGAYNVALWPVALALWITTAAAAVQLLRGRLGVRTAIALLGFHWAWSGIAYHALFFTRINPAARFFAILFVLQALLLWWFGIRRRRLAFDTGRLPRHYVGGALVVYALVYPGLVLLTGHQWPRAPLFAVPCPSTLLTVGVLLFARPPVPSAVIIIPLIWTVIAGSAALVLAMTPDFMLWVAGLVLLLYAIAPKVLAGRVQPN